MESINNNDDLINYYNFNEDASCISIGTKLGFKIITCNPYNNHHYRIFNRGIGIIEMYGTSNIIALTGSEKNTKFPLNKLIIWDDNKLEIIREIRFMSKIRIIKLIKDFLFLVNDMKVYAFNFDDLSLIDSFEIFSYKKEFISFSVNKNIKIAYCSKDKKEIHIKNIDTKKEIKKEIKNSIETKEEIIIKNQDDDLLYDYIIFSSRGNMIAGACKGKIILYNSSNGEIIREIINENLNNGSINCVSFSKNDKFLAISTVEDNSGRINIFDIGTKKEKSIFDFLLNDKESCFAYYELKYKEFLFNFDKDNENSIFIITLITSNAEFIEINFDKVNGGNCKKIKSKNIFY